MTHLNLILLNDCSQIYLGHTSILYDVGMPWGFFGYSCGLPDSSSDSRDLKNGHIYHILCTDAFLWGIEILVPELSHHIYNIGLAFCLLFWYHVSLSGMHNYQKLFIVSAYHLVIFPCFANWWEALFTGDASS